MGWISSRSGWLLELLTELTKTKWQKRISVYECICHFAFVSLVLQCECLCVSVSRECKLSQCVRRQNSDGVGDLLGVNQ